MFVAFPLQLLSMTFWQGGHYHYDTTPEEVEYLGYYNTAQVHHFHTPSHLKPLLQTCYRVDRPTVTHMVGRD